jgi:site-specific DNA-cytosine methylase
MSLCRNFDRRAGHLARARQGQEKFLQRHEHRNGKPLTKTDQVWMIGNAVPPVMAEALVRANVVEQEGS